jgi:hypothetical protein
LAGQKTLVYALPAGCCCNKGVERARERSEKQKRAPDSTDSADSAVVTGCAVDHLWPSEAVKRKKWISNLLQTIPTSVVCFTKQQVLGIEGLGKKTLP